MTSQTADDHDMTMTDEVIAAVGKTSYKNNLISLGESFSSSSWTARN